MATKKTKDLAPKKETKGGGIRLTNDNLTLAGTKKSTKDLSPKKETKGGRRVD